MLDTRVKAIIQYAYENSPFYKIFYDQNTVDMSSLDQRNDILNIPILTKEMVQVHKDEIVVDAMNSYRSHMIQVTRTSGTTGQVVEVLWNKNDFAKSILPVWRKRKEWYGITASSKCVVFNNFQYYDDVQTALKQKMINKTTLCLDRNFVSEEDTLFIVEQINNFSPDWIQIHPSVALRLIDLLNKYDVKTHFLLKYIELNGELVTESQKKYISQYFKVPVGNMYGANEVNSIALDCPQGHLHILKDNVYVEVTEKNEILVTNLHNHIMPIIRYKVGDVVSLIPSSCMDDQNDVIEVIEGRSIDYVVLKNGDLLSPYFMIQSIECINSILHKCIIRFQIEQETQGVITIFLEIKKKFVSWTDVLVQEINTEIYKYVPMSQLKIFLKINERDFNINMFHKFKLFRSKINE